MLTPDPPLPRARRPRRRNRATVPVTVSYGLTDLGLSLHATVRPLKDWAESHLDQVLAERAPYDARGA